jgi:hypothetical protein
MGMTTITQAGNGLALLGACGEYYRVNGFGAE